MAEIWDERHGITITPAKPENATFDFFRLLSLFWLWLEIERLKLAITETAKRLDRPTWVTRG